MTEIYNTQNCWIPPPSKVHFTSPVPKNCTLHKMLNDNKSDSVCVSVCVCVCVINCGVVQKLFLSQWVAEGKWLLKKALRLSPLPCSSWGGRYTECCRVVCCSASQSTRSTTACALQRRRGNRDPVIVLLQRKVRSADRSFAQKSCFQTLKASSFS